ncbi:MAG: DUF4340 domain-containing protein, partial [Planctomycetales bacterium]|nr:DUF4340 domain-containing protein [Planctomycetales bacterium]
PFAAKSLKVVEYNAELGESKSFEVAQLNNQWVIPSHHNYPADAADRLKEAATLLLDLEVISKVSDDASSHELYGVVEPAENTEPGKKGVGKLIQLENEKGDRLAQIVVGAEVPEKSNLRHVRVPGQSAVYVVEIDPSKVSTKFEDWIEQDLLKLNAFDLAHVEIRDYSVQPTVTPQGIAVDYQQRLDMTVNWDSTESKWLLKELKESRGNGLETVQLMESEELNTKKLDDMKRALDELKIVNVEPKPAGLGEDLKADRGIQQNRESMMSLMDQGFFPVGMGGGDSVELLSSDGEVIAVTKDAVRYTLRFGRIAASAGDEEENSKLNRFVMVTAEVDEQSLPEPTLEEVPDVDAAGQSAEESVAEEGAAEEGAAEEGADADAAKAARQAERDRILKENQRKNDEYKDKRQKAADKVRELNYRFADWYYVIGEDVYKNIHLARADVVQEKDIPVDEQTGIDAFRALEEKGLKRGDQP